MSTESSPRGSRSAGGAASGPREPRILVVNYHYVRPEGDEWGAGLHAVTHEQFESQLSALAAEGECLSPADLEGFLHDGETHRVPDRSFVLTFDDGLKEHAGYVAAELKQRSMGAYFFVCTQPWTGSLLDVHRLQMLNAAVPFDELSDSFWGTVRREFVQYMSSIPSDELVRSRYHYDPLEVARIKFMVQSTIPPTDRRRIVGQLFAAHLGTDEEYLDKWYLSETDCRELASRGFAVGCHTHSHAALDEMTRSEIANDLETNRGMLRDVLRGLPDFLSTLAYPFGAVNDDVESVCESIGFRTGFSMQRRMISGGASPLRLGRADTNDAPGGRRPSISLAAATV